MKQLAEDFAKYLYLPRVKNTQVLLDAIKDGLGGMLWREETFAYADSWDEQKKRYLGLQAGQSKDIALNAECVVVKPDVALKQMEADVAKAEEARVERAGQKPPVGTGVGAAKSQVDKTGVSLEPPIERKPRPPRRFHAAVRLDAARVSRDAGQIADEVIQHLVKLENSEVEITLEIQAKMPDGAPEDVVRTVSENCRTLKFSQFGFEEE